MVKVAGPMFSLSASGTLANAITFATWKGRPYVRERVIPSNPKSGGQVGRRAMFTFLSQSWAALAAPPKASWETLADADTISPYNAYVKANLKAWHNYLPPYFQEPAGAAGTPSDNVLTAAVWEENRIKLSLAGGALADAWGICIFAKAAGAVTPAVGNCILVELETTIAAHDIFWTPPTVDTWHFDSRAFADDGVFAALGGGQNAVP